LKQQTGRQAGKDIFCLMKFPVEERSKQGGGMENLRCNSSCRLSAASPFILAIYAPATRNKWQCSAEKGVEIMRECSTSFFQGKLLMCFMELFSPYTHKGGILMARKNFVITSFVSGCFGSPIRFRFVTNAA
jgi:hypothetical protein